MTDCDMVTITPISNAGVLLEYKGMKLIIDGIYSGEGHPFGAIPPDVWDRLLAGKPPFDEVQYLLFTHCHGDHFSPSLTLEYLKRNTVKGIFLPEADKHGELTEYLREKRIACVPLSPELGGAVFKLTESVALRVIKTGHLDRKFSSVEHYCFLITLGEKRLLFTGDADYLTESFAELGDTKLDAVFLNPLFFSAVCRERFFTGSFHTGLYCVYHLPPVGAETSADETMKRVLGHWDERRGRVILMNKIDRSLGI